MQNYIFAETVCFYAIIFVRLFSIKKKLCILIPVFRIRILRIRKFLGLPVLELLVKSTDPDPDPSIIKKK